MIAFTQFERTLQKQSLSIMLFFKTHNAVMVNYERFHLSLKADSLQLSMAKNNL